MPARGKDSYSIHSVENALAVLEALSEEDGEDVRISRLSEKLGINKTSIFRLLATFESRGYVEREKVSGRYRLGLSAYEIGQKFLSRMELLRKAKPVMERLARDCGEAVYLAVRREENALFLDLADSAQQVKVVSMLGKRYPLDANAAGKILLAHIPAEEENAPAGPSTPAEELHLIRQQGFCVSTGVSAEGISSLAVPLFGPGGEVAGALSIIGPDFRMTAEKMMGHFLPKLKEAGEIVSSKLGYLGHYLREKNL